MDMSADRDDPIGHLTVKGLAMRCLTPEQFRQFRLCILLPTALVLGALPLDRTALFVVAIRVIRPPLSVEFPLQTPNPLVIPRHRLAKLLQRRLCLANHRNRRGADVQPDRLGSDGMLRFPTETPGANDGKNAL